MEIISTYPFNKNVVVNMIYKGHEWEFECKPNYDIMYAVSLTAEDHPSDEEYKEIENYMKLNLL